MHPLTKACVDAENALHSAKEAIRHAGPIMVQYLIEGPPKLTKRQVARRIVRSPAVIDAMLSSWVSPLHWTSFQRLENLYYEEKAKHEQTSGDSAPRRDAQTDSEVSD